MKAAKLLAIFLYLVFAVCAKNTAPIQHQEYTQEYQEEAFFIGQQEEEYRKQIHNR
ncbi:MAG: hypothetical protein MUE44_34800 [Oscillatoriaceae cyanobacterium Prado104]|nr:hypothetical protein [Oscillatoriaceae cyanobacterium Prado104]